MIPDLARWALVTTASVIDVIANALLALAQETTPMVPWDDEELTR